MKSAGKARSNGLYRHIRTSKEIIRNLLNDSLKHEYKQERTTVKIINTIIVLFLFLKIYAIAFFSILQTSYLQIFYLRMYISHVIILFF